mgnify:CR=1 FL=1
MGEKSLLKIHYQQVIAFLVPGVIYFIANYNGLRLTIDSENYLLCAIHFSNTGAFFNAAHGIGCPPLFTLFLSIFSDNAVNWMLLWNGIFIMSTTLIWFTIAMKIFENQIIQWFSLVLLIFGADVLMVHSLLWTEPLFLFLLSFQFYFLIKFHQKGQINTLVWIIVFGILHTLQRKTGVFFNLSILLVLTWHFIQQGRSQRILIKLVSLVLLFLGVILWELFMQNHSGLSKSSFEMPDPTFFWPTMENYLNAISLWIIPLNSPAWIKFSSTTLLLSGMLWGILAIKNKAWRWITVSWMIYFFIRLFWPRLLFSEAQRYMAVAYPFFVISLMGLVQMIVFKTKYKNLILLLFGLWLVYPTVRTIKNALFYNQITQKY